jgi:hypothetical protein
MENWGVCGCHVRISGMRSAATYVTGNNPSPSWLKKYVVFPLVRQWMDVGAGFST